MSQNAYHKAWLEKGRRELLEQPPMSVEQFIQQCREGGSLGDLSLNDTSDTKSLPRNT